ncbi:hypothetical protein MMC25_002604 [Agyrium rufum]|nr:hypothetical protein [Agyrium rufum]
MCNQHVLAFRDCKHFYKYPVTKCLAGFEYDCTQSDGNNKDRYCHRIVVFTTDSPGACSDCETLRAKEAQTPRAQDYNKRFLEEDDDEDEVTDIEDDAQEDMLCTLAQHLCLPDMSPRAFWKIKQTGETSATDAASAFSADATDETPLLKKESQFPQRSQPPRWRPESTSRNLPTQTRYMAKELPSSRPLLFKRRTTSEQLAVVSSKATSSGRPSLS